MKKKKKSRTANVSLSPENYIRQRGRSLPLYKCFVNSNWKEDGVATIYIARKHSNGNITYAKYFVDLLCLGVKDTEFLFNVPEYILEEELEKYPVDITEAGYTLLHNIIYGAIEFASEYGFSPHSRFKITRYLLEEDDENIELMDIKFGDNGKPLLIEAPDDKNFEKNLAILGKNAGTGNFDFITLDDHDYYYDDDDDVFYDVFDDTAYDYSINEEDIEMLHNVYNIIQEFVDKVSEEKNMVDFLNEKDLSLLSSSIDVFYKIYIMNLFEKKLLTEEDLESLYSEISQYFPENISNILSPEIMEVKDMKLFKKINKITEEIYHDINDNNKKEHTFLKLNELAREYSEIPYIQALRAEIFALLNHPDKDIIINEVYEKFPDFYKTKLIMFHNYVETGRLDEAERFINGNYSLTEFINGKSNFFYNDVLEYFSTLIIFLLGKKEVLKATITTIILDSFYEETDYIKATVSISLSIAILNEVKHSVE